MQQTQMLLGVYRDQAGNNLYTYHPDYHVDYTDTSTGKFETLISSLNTPDLRDSYVATEAGRYPPSYYLYDSFFVSLVNSADIFTRVFLARFGSVILSIAMAFVVWRTGLVLFKKRSLARALTIMVMLQPMFSFLSAGVNSDNLHNLLFASVILSGLTIIESGISLPLILATVGVVALDIYTKPQGFVAIPVLGLAILIHVIRRKEWKATLWIIGLVLVVAAATVSQWKKYFGLIFTPNYKQASFLDYVSHSRTVLLQQNVVWFWGVFKWLGVVLPPIYWRVANRVVLLSIFGIIVYFWKVWKKKKIFVEPYSVSYMLLTVIIYAVSIFWFDWQYTKSLGFSIGVQARYFFPVITAMFGLMLTGITSLGWAPRIRRYLSNALVILFISLQLGGVWRLISSYYDVSSLQSFMIQVSQYKPFFAKGSWWYLWGTLYLVSLIYLAKIALFPGKKLSERPNRK
jgi:4-amino-4-deoxy-L-arabinose transferase-like glycosyltransferase